MTKILLTRHGHVEGIKPERFRGRAELALTAQGKAEVDALAGRIASAWRPDAIYTSPMGRCVATGAAIGQACGAATQILDQLNDIDYGAWQWKTHDEVRSTDPALFAAWYAQPHLMRFPGGESLQELAARAADAMRLILAQHGGGTVVAVGHDSVNRALLMQLLDQPLSLYWRLAQDPACLNEIDVIDGRVRVIRINETHHLAALQSG